MIIDHMSLGVLSYQLSKDFYIHVLDVLNIKLLVEMNGWAGFGRHGKPEFWIGECKDRHSRTHIAFAADSREQVQGFYQVALDSGGKSNGPPGIRGIYHPQYYGAFILDPDGYNIEAVCHTPQGD